MIWYDGGSKAAPADGACSGHTDAGGGPLFIGENGKLLSGYYGGNNRLLPEKRFRDFRFPEKTLARTVGHYKEWVQAAKEGGQTSVNFDFGGRMTEVAQLGAMAARCARPLLWDALRRFRIPSFTKLRRCGFPRSVSRV